MELGTKIKQRVDELTSDIRDGIMEKHNEILATNSHITKMCDEKTKWCDDKESKIDNFVDKTMAGHLYLISRHFEKEVSDARSHLKEIKQKHAFKGFDFKENNVILKCLFEDLEEVCEQQEVTGSDDGSANDVCASTTKINKTRRELTALLKKVKQDLDQSEKTRNALCDELKQVKQDKDNLEKKRKILEQELLRAKQDKKESEKEEARVKVQLSRLKYIKWTQPTGTVNVKTTSNEYGWTYISLVFTFPDGIQTAGKHHRSAALEQEVTSTKNSCHETHHPSPGKPYKGGTFTGRLFSNSEGQLLCRMLKAAFRRGLMFIVGKEGKIVLDGISLYDGYVHYGEWKKYAEYTRTLKAELAAKGITEGSIDQTEKLEETFTVNDPSLLEAALSS